MKRETRSSIRALCLASATSMPKGYLQTMPMSSDTVAMAQTELAHGKSAAMKAMARLIIAAQRKEIAQFDRWPAKPECLL